MRTTRGTLLVLIVPVAWTLSTLLGTALSGPSCGAPWLPAPWAIGLLLGGVVVGLMLWRRAASAQPRGPRRFAAVLAAALALLLALPLLLQLLTSLLIAPCAA